MATDEGGMLIVVVSILGLVADGTVAGIMLAVAVVCGDSYAAG